MLGTRYIELLAVAMHKLTVGAKVGYTALHIAIMQGDEKMYMELLAAGAKMAPKDGSPSFLMDMLRLRVEAEDLRIVLEHLTSFPPQVQDSIAREFTPGLKAEVCMESDRGREEMCDKSIMNVMGGKGR